MGPIDEIVGSFFISMASGLVMGVAILLIIYKMVDGEFPVVGGLVAIAANALMMALNVHPPHPALPGVTLILVITLVAFFPYASGQLERLQNEAIDVERLQKMYMAAAARPDNTSARLETAQMLYAQGFVHQAIAVAQQSLAGLSSEVDKVRNQSTRDMFGKEARLLGRWMQTPVPPTAAPASLKCPVCGKLNEPHELVCAGCGRPYMLDIIEFGQVRGKVVTKLLISWAAVAVFFIGIMAIALNFSGIVMWSMIVGAGIAVGFFMTWLFKKPGYSAT